MCGNRFISCLLDVHIIPKTTLRQSVLDSHFVIYANHFAPFRLHARLFMIHYPSWRTKNWSIPSWSQEHWPQYYLRCSHQVLTARKKCTDTCALGGLSSETASWWESQQIESHFLHAAMLWLRRCSKPVVRLLTKRQMTMPSASTEKAMDSSTKQSQTLIRQDGTSPMTMARISHGRGDGFSGSSFPAFY